MANGLNPPIRGSIVAVLVIGIALAGCLNPPIRGSIVVSNFSKRIITSSSKCLNPPIRGSIAGGWNSQKQKRVSIPL